MPDWSSTPPKDRSNLALRIVRTPPIATLSAIVTCPGLIGCATHYVNNRTRPCDGQGKCEWCEAGHSWRWHGYLSCILTATVEHVIFEMTATASDTFTNYYALKGTLIGCHFQARRPSGRHNGRVVIACKPSDPQKVTLPPPVNVQKILSHVWGIPYAGLGNPGRTRPLVDRVGVVPDKQNGRHQLRSATPIP